MSPIASWLVTALALIIGDRLLSGVFVGGIVPALVAAAVLGLVNLTVKPILFILTLPITLVTLGLFLFVLNAMMLGIVGWFVPGFAVANLWSGIGLSIIVAVVQAVALSLFGPDRRVRLDD